MSKPRVKQQPPNLAVKWFNCFLWSNNLHPTTYEPQMAASTPLPGIHSTSKTASGADEPMVMWNKPRPMACQISLNSQIRCLGWQLFPAPLKITSNGRMQITPTTRTACNSRLEAWTQIHLATKDNQQEHHASNEENYSTQKALGYKSSHFEQQTNIEPLHSKWLVEASLDTQQQ